MTTLMYGKDTLEIDDEVIAPLLSSKIMKTNSKKFQDEDISVA